MKKLILSVTLAVLGLALLTPEADARRLGGGGSAGMKRSVPTRTTPDAPPPQQAAAAPGNQAAQAAPAQTAGAATTAAAAPKRSWMGPIAGLAAGLGLAALMSHLGWGAEFGNIIMLVLLGIVALVAVRWLMTRFAGNGAATRTQGLQFAGAGAGGAQGMPREGMSIGAGPSAHAVPVPTAAAAATAPDFDREAFERVAKLIFIRMQAANDAGDLDDLRRFTTPELFAAVKLELQERSGAAQRTDVVQLEAQVVDSGEEDGRQVVSVRFHGLIREDANAPAAPFDEVWHLVRPLDSSRDWAIAGIAQTA